jgi:molecular chaperone DnaK (HSP70)
MNPENTVFDAKRLIGRKVSDAVVQADMKHWPFKVRAVSVEVLRCAAHHYKQNLVVGVPFAQLYLTSSPPLAAGVKWSI